MDEINQYSSLNSKRQSIVIGKVDLTIEDIIAASQQKLEVSLNDDPAFQDRIRRGADFLQKILANGDQIYGVTTGFGDSVSVTVPESQFDELSLHLPFPILAVVCL